MKFIVKYWKDISNFVFQILGLILTIVGLSKQDSITGKLFFWTLCIAFAIALLQNMVMVFLYVRKKSDEGEKMTEIESLKKDIDNCCEKANSYKKSFEELINRISYFMKKNTLETNLYSSAIVDYTYDYFHELDEIEKEIDLIADKADISFAECMEDPDINEKNTKALLRAVNHFCKNSVYTMNTYFQNYIEDISSLITSFICSDGGKYSASVCVKLFNNVYYKDYDESKIRIATAYRDKSSNGENKKREIWEEEFTIEGNSAFKRCLKKEQCIYNNLKEDELNYDNQNGIFFKHYNCTITVPIIYHLKNDRLIYGFLCCDILKDDISDETVFTDQHAKILVSAGCNMGHFMETLCGAWIDVVDDITVEEYNMSWLGQLFEENLHK